jgi:uncharacterized protein YjbI with pentapeptide repeats
MKLVAKQFGVVCLLVVVASARAEAPYHVEWSRQIGTTAYDTSFNVAVDAAGNVYITGGSDGSLGGPNAGGGDAFLTKYDRAGNLLWSGQIGTTANELSFDVAVDAAGNAYIGGFTSGSLGGPHAGDIGDVFLTKYDSAGNLLWSRQFGTTNNEPAGGCGVAVDAAGNAYITGGTNGSLGGPNTGDYDAFLTKYDSAGNLLWSRQFGTTAWDRSSDVAVDAAGNAYIGGFTEGSLGGPNAGDLDAFLTKYDGAGNLLWSRQTGTTGRDFGGGVAIDAAGNVYTSGGTAGDAFLTKYDGAGNLLWSHQFGTTAYDTSNETAVDAAGNVYISGLTYDSVGGPNVNDSDAFLTKYDGAGNLLWSRQIGTTAYDVSRGVAVDAAGNAYISGDTQGSLGGPSAGGFDAFLIKFSVPEPATFILAAALLGLCITHRRRCARHENRMSARAHGCIRRLGIVLALSIAAATLFGIGALSARADIYQWYINQWYIDPGDPPRGKQQSTSLCPDGAGVNAVPGASLSGRNLTMAYLDNGDLTNANLTQANLTNASLVSANLTGTNLTQANLTNVDFTFATLTGTNFTGALVQGATFAATSFTAAQLYSTASYQAHDLSGIFLGGWDFPGANLAGFNLTTANVSYSNFTGANLSQANLANTNLDSATLTGANLTGAAVQGAVLANTTSQGFTAAQLYSTASYQAHDLTGIFLHGNNLAGWNFAGQNLTNAKFFASMLTGADFSGAIVNGASFERETFSGTGGITTAQLYSTASYQAHDLTGIGLTGNNLSGANLSGQNLTNAVLAFNANLTSANLSQANLTNANFYGSTLTGAILNGAIVNDAEFSRNTFNGIGGITSAQLYSTTSYQMHDLSGIRFYAADLTGWNFAGQNLTNASFRSAILSAADLTGAVIQGADFGSATDFTVAKLYSTASYQAHDLSGIGLERQDLTGANVTGQNLANASFHAATLTGVDFTGADVRGANFALFTEDNLSFIGTGITLSQLYSTASYQARDLSGIDFSYNETLFGANLASQNLTNGIFALTFSFDSGADLTGADTRGAQRLFLDTSTTTNTIRRDGHIQGLDLVAGKILMVRDYDGDPSRTDPAYGTPTPVPPIPIQIDQHFFMGAGAALQFLFESDPWDSLISFSAGIPVSLGGGTLDLQFADGVAAASQIGRTFHVFDWTGVNPIGTFNVTSPFVWDLSKLYTTGEITFLAAAGIAGDFNGDGTVDAADYVVWRKIDGSQAGYDVWRTHFGQPAGICAAIGLSSDASVPEPASALLLLVFGAALGIRRGSRVASRVPSTR